MRFLGMGLARQFGRKQPTACPKFPTNDEMITSRFLAGERRGSSLQHCTSAAPATGTQPLPTHPDYSIQLQCYLPAGFASFHRIHQRIVLKRPVTPFPTWFSCPPVFARNPITSPQQEPQKADGAHQVFRAILSVLWSVSAQPKRMLCRTLFTNSVRTLLVSVMISAWPVMPSLTRPRCSPCVDSFMQDYSNRLPEQHLSSRLRVVAVSDFAHSEQFAR